MSVTLTWEGDLRFRASGPAGAPVIMDGGGATALSPMDNLLAALAACMGSDIVDIMRKGRQEVSGLSIRASGTRREQPPRRYLTIALAIEIEGSHLDPAKAQRAVDLSRSTYCSVWSSLAPDIDFDVTLAIRDSPSAPG